MKIGNDDEDVDEEMENEEVDATETNRSVPSSMHIKATIDQLDISRESSRYQTQKKSPATLKDILQPKKRAS